jgi:acyl-CoA synthetase (AMP-forming)/AMP-acid ligase II
MNTGGRLVLVKGRSFVPEITAKAIGDEGINVINLVGDAMARPLAEVILANPSDYDVSGLVALSSAGAILSDSVKKQLEAALPDTMVLNNFGASETGHQGTAVDMGDGKLRFFMHGDATLVVDDDMNTVAVGEEGWIARKGHVPLGYYRDEEKTKKTFTEIDGQRYVVPGDRGILEEETIILLGRGSICINTGGEKVFPEEVEEALKGHPAIMDAIVVGLPDEKWGQRVSALVLVRDGHTCSEEDISAHCRSKVAGYKTPRSWFFVDTLNRQPSGKPDYRWAKARALELSEA